MSSESYVVCAVHPCIMEVAIVYAGYRYNINPVLYAQIINITSRIFAIVQNINILTCINAVCAIFSTVMGSCAVLTTS